MSEPVQNPDPEQQRHDNRESRRQSGLEPRPREREPDEDGDDGGDGEARTGGEGKEAG